jgi:hypothetical protein
LDRSDAVDSGNAPSTPLSVFSVRSVLLLSSPDPIDTLPKELEDLCDGGRALRDDDEDDMPGSLSTRDIMGGTLAVPALPGWSAEMDLRSATLCCAASQRGAREWNVRNRAVSGASGTL